MPGHDIIVVGASTGGVEALSQLARDLPADLPAAVFVVLHLSPDVPSSLGRILDHAGPLPARQARDGDPIEPGHIYVAPPDLHLVVARGAMRTPRGPRENRHRPAVDALFRSAARAYGPRVIGVVLTGALDDGTAGLLEVKRAGGLAAVQDPHDALAPGMPSSALEYVAVDACLPLDSIAPLLAEWARQPSDEPNTALAAGREGDAVASLAEREAEAVAQSSESDKTAETTMERTRDNPWRPTPFTCPDCKGPIFEASDAGFVRLRCREGHTYSGETMLAGQAEQVERALWVALETLDESARLCERLAAQARARTTPRIAQHFDWRAEEARAHASSIRRVLEGGTSLLPTPDDTHEIALSEGAAR